MFYVFLDIDGVLNVKTNELEGIKDVNMFCVRRFVEALENMNDVRIVLISEWRKWFHSPGNCEGYLNYLQNYLRKYGLEICDKTHENQSLRRETEIRMYITRHRVKDYIILDDEKFRYTALEDHVFWVNGEEGFSIENQHRLQNKIRNSKDEEEYGDVDVADFFWDEFESVSENLNEISFRIKPRETFTDTGRALLRYFAKEVFPSLSEVISVGMAYELRTKGTIEVTVERDKFLAFLQILDQEIDQLFPIGKAVEIFQFEAEEPHVRLIIRDAINEYLKLAREA